MANLNIVENPNKNVYDDCNIIRVEQSVYDELLRKIEKNKSNTCFLTHEYYYQYPNCHCEFKLKVSIREYHGDRRLFWSNALIMIEEEEEEEEEEEFEYENCEQDKTLDIITVGGGGMMNGNAYATVEKEDDKYYYCEYGKNPSREYIGNKIVYSTKEKHGYAYNFNIIEEEDFIETKCKTCGFRVGSHSLTESYQCKLITKEEYEEKTN